MAAKRYEFESGPSGPRLSVVAPEPGGEADPKAEQQKAQAERSSVVRRRDAVVDASRTLDDLSPDGVRKIVTQRWRGTKVLEESDVESFSADARAQRVDDVADALDSRVRRGVLGRGARHVRVDAPRGWIKSSLRAMEAADVSSLRQRLVDRGWEGKDVDKSLRAYLKGLNSGEEKEPVQTT